MTSPYDDVVISVMKPMHMSWQYGWVTS